MTERVSEQYLSFVVRFSASQILLCKKVLRNFVNVIKYQTS